jgi:TetR/AcrR family transcriptional repressor of nem operon
MMKKESNPSPTKTKILDAALSVIRSKGYSATTVDDLCAEAGVTKGAFFHHFKSKEDLGVSAAEYWSTVTNAHFEKASYHRHSDPLDRLLAYIDLRQALLEGEVPEFTCLVGTMVQEAYDSSPAIREACRKSIFGHAANVAKDIEEAKRKYAPNAEWSSESLALHTQAVIQGAFILAKSEGRAKLAAESISHLRRYLEFLFNRKPKRN